MDDGCSHRWQVISHLGHVVPVAEAPCLYCGLLFGRWSRDRSAVSGDRVTR